MGRWDWQDPPDSPLITSYFGFMSRDCMLLCHSCLPFLQGETLKKHREWWRGEQECELLGRGKVKHHYRSQFIGTLGAGSCGGITSSASDPLAKCVSLSAVWETLAWLMGKGPAMCLKWEQGKRALPWQKGLKEGETLCHL